MKRFYDLVFGTCLIVILLPIMLIIAIMIRLDSKGSVFFRQERVGFQGKSFYIYKFRSMVANASQQGPYFTVQGDTRITKVGSFLRKTSLDELPQLLNVLKGDMSFIGPRPDVPAMRELYTQEEWEHRHRVRPGITGLAQATVRSEATMEERKRLDLEYVDQCGLLLDVRIIIWTCKQLIRKGSY